MANVTKTASGRWRFQVTINYKPHVKTFDTKAEGYAWEEELKAGKGKAPKMTFGKLLEKYRDEVSVNKKGERWERIRINMFLQAEFAKLDISQLSKPVFAQWRDKRLKEVSALSVLREWALLSHCLQIAVNEWELLPDNPMKGLKKPKGAPPRDRLVSEDEIKMLCYQLNYTPDGKVESITSRVGAAFVFAIETAFRAQEICNLKWSDIKGKVAKINDSKTYAGVREVPLTKRAVEIIQQCKGLDDTLVFNINSSQLDSLFRKAKKNAGIENLHFHDTRAEAITRLSKKMHILDLARAVGHKDLKMLMVYYRKSAKDIAHTLD